MSRIRIRPTANEDIDREAINLASYAGVDAGLRFYDACEQSFSLLASYPDLGVKRDFGFSSLADLRVWRPRVLMITSSSTVPCKAESRF